MNANADRTELAPEQFRAYLTALARLQVAARPRHFAGLDITELLQETIRHAGASRDECRAGSAEEMARWLRNIFGRVLATTLRSHPAMTQDTGDEDSLEAELEASWCRIDAWLTADSTPPNDWKNRSDRVQSLAAAIVDLPAEQRTVILMMHCHGQGLADISARLGRSPAVVAGWLRHGLARLEERLKENGT